MSGAKQSQIKYTKAGLNSLKKEQLLTVVLELNKQIENVRSTSEVINSKLTEAELNLDEVKTMLRDLKQKDSYENYARKFWAIVNLLDDMTEKDKIFWLTEGLNHKTKYEVKSKKCETLEDAFKVAARYES